MGKRGQEDGESQRGWMAPRTQCPPGTTEPKAHVSSQRLGQHSQGLPKLKSDGSPSDEGEVNLGFPFLSRSYLQLKPNGKGKISFCSVES